MLASTLIHDLQHLIATRGDLSVRVQEHEVGMDHDDRIAESDDTFITIWWLSSEIDPDNEVLEVI